MLTLDSTTLYGATPQRAAGTTPTKVATGGRVVAPSAATSPTAAATVDSLAGDPSFWLAALVGAAAAAAIYAAS